MNLPSAVPAGIERFRRRVTFLVTGVLLHGVALWLWIWFLLPLFVVSAAALVPVLLAAASVVPRTRLQRGRFAWIVGVEIPATPAIPGRYGPTRVHRRLGSRTYWRQLVFHQAVGLLLGVAEAVVLALWAAGLAAVFVFVWARPAEDSPEQVLVVAAGVVILGLVPRLVDALIRFEQPIALRLLGPSLAEDLAQRVEDLTERRADTVAAADAERRRIERDLHDGAQQRLVSLAVNLGLARVTLTDLPPEARRVIDDAHREAKAAIEELGRLVRGLHPVVLEDRGLDAALFGVAAGSTVPVRLRVDLASRPAPAVEAVAYFVVTEALTNITKHARAEQAEVSVVRERDILRVSVTDDGTGGADPAAGSGLAGLRRRVASVDGTFRLSSPRGGPTVITVELPCVL
ncbi:sensor histidine kinase [Embleya sp. AB8]|uniref:sensor histidine kinase n=1 Tax=Embleya sp. AB8 TaxID=3156304 RepID=UPI003C72F288